MYSRGGKVAQDAIDEIREAVDFCRFYASLSKSDYASTVPLGTVLCISPWNFPLAIFLGQITAALSVGNAVIAKPAEQTVLVAKKACRLLASVGFPENSVQLVIATGNTVGEQLVANEKIKGVMFTGSTATGQVISRTLLDRADAPVPLLAETGGQNCMIVDSTALLEQVVADVIHSGFQSAGQRCSALRVLFVQDDIADNLITMLIGAMKALVIGHPKYLSTDVGPVIDQAAVDKLNLHVDYLADKAKLLFACKLPNELAEKQTFFAPRLYELSHISILKEEVFGPCVHVIRFKQTDLEHVIDNINATGFGLTMGLHSRIEGRSNKITRAIKAGNIYVNRNMIGAIVGSQPFGGHGLSGTGPKAGGPHYLSRLVLGAGVQSKNTVSIDLPSDYVVVDLLFNQAKMGMHLWHHFSLDERVNRIRSLNARLAESVWIEQFNNDLDVVFKKNDLTLSEIAELLANATVLPGPTGELNQLTYEPRGTVLLYASLETDFSSWMKSLLSVIATGNSVLTVLSDEFCMPAEQFFLGQKDIIPKGVIQVVSADKLSSLLKDSRLALLLTGDECEAIQFIAKQLKHREGPLMNWFNIRSPYLNTQLLLEKTISIDTTAAGGNMALLSIDSSI